MNILLVSHSSSNPDAGASRVYHLLEDGLTGRGHSVKTLHLEDFNIPRALTKFAQRLIFPQVASLRVTREEIDRYDVIMCSNGMLYPFFKQQRSKRQRPLLVNHIHGLNFFDYRAIISEKMRGHLSQALVNRLITGPLPAHWDLQGCLSADLTVVQNERDLDFLLDKGTANMLKIPLSVHPEIMAASQTAPSPEERDPLKLLWFGGWTERKGVHYLPRAFAEVCKSVPRVRLTIGGTSLPEEVIMEKFDPSLRARISVLPNISRAEQITEFANHSIFLFPSLSEGFGYALLEALSMGLAVITTQTGLGADFLRDGKNCRIVPMASSVHLAKATIDLIGDPSLRKHISEEGRLMSQAFTTERFVVEYESAFVAYREKQVRQRLVPLRSAASVNG